jgi:hypothetical protein
MNEGPLCLDCVEKPRFGRVIGTIAAGGEVYGAEPGGAWRMTWHAMAIVGL